MPEYHYGHIRSPSLRNVCFDEGDADKEKQSSTVRKSQLVQWRKELVRVDREGFPEGTEV